MSFLSFPPAPFVHHHQGGLSPPGFRGRGPTVERMRKSVRALVRRGLAWVSQGKSRFQDSCVQCSETIDCNEGTRHFVTVQCGRWQRIPSFWTKKSISSPRKFFVSFRCHPTTRFPGRLLVQLRLWLSTSGAKAALTVDAPLSGALNFRVRRTDETNETYTEFIFFQQMSEIVCEKACVTSTIKNGDQHTLLCMMSHKFSGAIRPRSYTLSTEH